MKLFLIFLILCNQSFGAVSYRVNDGTSQNIEEFGTCWKIANSSGKDVFVPTATNSEWTTFYTQLATGITKSSCCPANTQTFNTDGTFTTPIGCRNITFKAWGGGGGGGATNGPTAGNGGGAGYSSDSIAVVTGDSFTITLGTGGNAGDCSSGAGGSGGYNGSSGTVGNTDASNFRFKCEKI